MNTTNIRLRHLPNQHELSESLNMLKTKVLKNYHLPYTKQQIGKLQALCPNFRDVYNFINEGLLPSTKAAAKRIINISDKYVIVDSVLFLLSTRDDIITLKLAVPQSVVPYIMSLYHDSLLACHQGMIRMAETIKEKFHFPHLYQQVANYVKTCHTCQMRKQPQGTERPFELNIYTNGSNVYGP